MGKRIVSPKTSNLMKALIQLNVTEGTKKFVEVQGSRTWLAWNFTKRKYQKMKLLSELLSNEMLSHNSDLK